MVQKVHSKRNIIFFILKLNLKHIGSKGSPKAQYY